MKEFQLACDWDKLTVVLNRCGTEIRDDVVLTFVKDFARFLLLTPGQEWDNDEPCRITSKSSLEVVCKALCRDYTEL